MSKRKPTERAIFEAIIGDVMCTAGRGTKCIYKKNTSVLGSVKAVRCDINATKDVCVKAGVVIE